MSATPDPPDPQRVASADAADAARWIELASRGDFEAAWRVSDRVLARRRGRPVDHLPRHVQPVWDGTPLRGRRVLIRCYHGLGDTLQFIRYAPVVKSVASEVIVWAQRPLLPLLASMGSIDRLVALHDGAPEVAADVHVEVMELPFVFRTTLATIPASVPYLSVTPACPPDDATLPRIGLVWRSGAWNPRRSIPFGLFETIIDRTLARWYLLQQDIGPDERRPDLPAIAGATVLETARRMRAMDLVITIDSMPAHLAGALAVPVWTILPHAADWRWMQGRSDSPWYPTMRLFRQQHPDDWESVLHGVREALAGWIGAHPHPSPLPQAGEGAGSR